MKLSYKIGHFYVMVDEREAENFTVEMVEEN